MRGLPEDRRHAASDTRKALHKDAPGAAARPAARRRPHPAHAAALGLQRSAGNRAAAGMLQRALHEWDPAGHWAPSTADVAQGLPQGSGVPRGLVGQPGEVYDDVAQRSYPSLRAWEKSSAPSSSSGSAPSLTSGLTGEPPDVASPSAVQALVLAADPISVGRPGEAKTLLALLAERLADPARPEGTDAVMAKTTVSLADLDDASAILLLRSAQRDCLGISTRTVRPEAAARALQRDVQDLAAHALAGSGGTGLAREIAAAKQFRGMLESSAAGSSQEANALRVFGERAARAAFATALAASYLSERPKAGFEDPTLLGGAELGGEQDEGAVLQMARELLAEAVKKPTALERLGILAKAIRGMEGGMTKPARALLERYLRAELAAFVYRFQPGAGGVVTWSLFGDVKQLDATGRESDLPRDHPLWASIREAWTTIERVVAPAILAQVGPCAIRMHPSALYRPNYGSRVISVGNWRFPASTILHEFGHHLEDRGTPTRWLCLHQLLQERSGGGRLASIFPFTIPYVISSAEQQYSVTMPAWWYAGGWFGYSAKYYSGGGTEVVATTLEVFGDAERMFKIALLDPELFIAVMGMLRE